jgi:hypothetical protein
LCLAGLAGSFERAAMLIPSIWGFTLLWRLWTGTPFMHVAVISGIKGDMEITNGDYGDRSAF